MFLDSKRRDRILERVVIEIPEIKVFFLYCCTVHFEDSLIIKSQQMHYYMLCLF
jgi:hypothetical protein